MSISPGDGNNQLREFGIVRGMEGSLHFEIEGVWPEADRLKISSWLQISKCFREDFMKLLSAAVKKELNSFERNTRIQTEALADTTGMAGAENTSGAKKKGSNKEDEDENAEDNEEYDEGKLRFAGGPPSIWANIINLEADLFPQTFSLTLSRETGW